MVAKKSARARVREARKEQRVHIYNAHESIGTEHKNISAACVTFVRNSTFAMHKALGFAVGCPPVALPLFLLERVMLAILKYNAILCAFE